MSASIAMLHGRTAFSGPRWLRGIYLDEAAGPLGRASAGS